MVRVDLHMPTVRVTGLGLHDIGLRMYSGSFGINGGQYEVAQGWLRGHLRGQGTFCMAEKCLVSITSVERFEFPAIAKTELRGGGDIGKNESVCPKLDALDLYTFTTTCLNSTNA
jgi:hypothetical protein